MAAPVVDIAWASAARDHHHYHVLKAFPMANLGSVKRLITTEWEARKRNQVSNSSNLIWRVLLAKMNTEVNCYHTGDQGWGGRNIVLGCPYLPFCLPDNTCHPCNFRYR